MVIIRVSQCSQEQQDLGQQLDSIRQRWLHVFFPKQIHRERQPVKMHNIVMICSLISIHCLHVFILRVRRKTSKRFSGQCPSWKELEKQRVRNNPAKLIVFFEYRVWKRSHFKDKKAISMMCCLVICALQDQENENPTNPILEFWKSQRLFLFVWVIVFFIVFSQLFLIQIQITSQTSG